MTAGKFKEEINLRKLELEAEGHDIFVDEDEWGNILLVCRDCGQRWRLID